MDNKRFINWHGDKRNETIDVLNYSKSSKVDAKLVRTEKELEKIGQEILKFNFPQSLLDELSFDLKETTIPYQVEAKYGAAQVIIKPAPQGTGIRAGASMRAVLEQSGVKDVVAKSLRSQNPINVVRATISALGQLSEKNAGAEEVQDGGSEDVQN